MADVTIKQPSLAAVPITRGVSDSPRHFNFIDALRGVAILGVILLHCSMYIPKLPAGGKLIAKQGEYGVQLFFIISAFTLFWSLHSRYAADAKPLRAFYIRRLFRVAPLFWLGAVFYTAIGWASHADFGPTHVTPATFVATLLFVHGWHPASINTVVPGGWSIGAEVMFYLCIPTLFLHVRHRRAAMALTFISTAVVAIGTPFVRRYMVSHFPTYAAAYLEKSVFWSFPAQLPVFCMGFVLYFLLKDRMDSPTTPPKTKSGIFQPLIFFFFAAIIALSLFGKVHQVFCSSIFVALAYSLFIYPAGLIVNRAMRFIGKVSYSSYIWHFWILYKIAPTIARLNYSRLPKSIAEIIHLAVLFFVTLAITLLASTVSYHVVELPGQMVAKNIVTYCAWGPKGRRPNGVGRTAPLPR